MLCRRFSSIYLVTWFLTLFISFVNPFKGEIKLSSKNVSALNSDVSHEEIHSKNDNHNSSLKHMDTVNNNSSNQNATHKTSRINTDKARVNNTTNVKNGTIIAVEGGIISVPNIIKLKAVKDNNSQSNNDSHKIVTVATSAGNKNVTNNRTTALPTLMGNVSPGSSKSKKIHHGSPIFEPDSSSPPPHVSSTTTATTTKRRKKKPLFTMVPSDDVTKGSDSFIESSTTGRDYVLPIVLIILALPLVGYIVKLIYRRGTEFTERQQYHRMYLIDGMYNSR